MLAEMVCTVELLALIAFAELVDIRQVFASCQPVGLWEVGELLATITANIEGSRWDGSLGLLGVATGVWWSGRAWVEGSFEVAFKGRT